MAIVVSLLFVGFELHQTRKQSELNNWRDLLVTLVDYKGRTQEAEFAYLVVRGQHDYHALSESDRLRFGLYMEQGVHIIGNFVKHNDTLPRKLVGLENAIGNMFYEMLASSGGAAWWQEAKERKRFMPDTYRITDHYLQRRVKNGGAPI